MQVDAPETQALRDEWMRLGLPVDLKVLESPYREVTKPVLDYVKNIRRKSPRDVVTVFKPAGPPVTEPRTPRLRPSGQMKLDLG